MVNGPILQNDYRLKTLTSMAPFGCYVTTIREIVERHYGSTLSAEQWIEAYRWLVAEGHVRDDADGPREDGTRLRAYVQDVNAVGRAVQYYLGQRQTFREVGREYLGGAREGYGNVGKGKYFIVQARMDGWRISHFFEGTREGARVWDPYWPGKPVLGVVSIRGITL